MSAGGVMNTAMEVGHTVSLAALTSVAATRTDVVDGYAWAFGTAGAVYVAAALAATALVPLVPTRRHAAEPFGTVLGPGRTADHHEQRRTS